MSKRSVFVTDDVSVEMVFVSSLCCFVTAATHVTVPRVDCVAVCSVEWFSSKFSRRRCRLSNRPVHASLVLTSQVSAGRSMTACGTVDRQAAARAVTTE